jgi:type IV pilus assembly protein PilP
LAALGLGLLSLGVLISGCDRAGTAALQAYITEVKARPPAPIEPLPEIPSVDAFTFDPTDRRDPFVMDRQSAGAAQSDNSLAPDPNRPKEPLEAYPLTDLSMVGTMAQGGSLWALIRDKEGLLFRTRVGQYMGQNNGQIIEITEDTIRLVEVVSDLSGEWRESQQTIRLVEP